MAEGGSTEPEVASHSWLERSLALITDVRPGEAATALLLMLNVFVLLGAYYFLKVVREPLILRDGADHKVYASAAMALLLVPLLLGFERLAERVNRMRLIAASTAFFLVCLAVFGALARLQVRIGFAFFVWVGIFNVFVIAQFWGFANDVYTEQQGRRLFPMVAVGSSLGAIVGGKVGGMLFRMDHIAHLCAVAAVLLVVSLGLTFAVHRREHARVDAVSASRQCAEQALAPGGGFALLVRDRYLALIAVLAVVYNSVNTVGEYVLDRAIIHAAHGTAVQVAAFEAHFRSDFFTVVNVVGLLLQLVVVSRVLRYVGVRVALLVMPVISLVGYGGIAAGASLAVMCAAKAAENSADYSIQSTTRHALFLLTTREAKYKAKALIDSFFVRSGDVIAAALVWFGTERLHLAERGFAAVNVALVFVWVIVALRVGALYTARSRVEEEERDPVKTVAEQGLREVLSEPSAAPVG